MRRANQISGNGQYRIVVDHLGSPTLILETPTNNTAPRVVQRQYSKPYGETAWSYTESSSMTYVGYTGQRLDGESGLMYYGVRYYDPALSFFVSADNIAPLPSAILRCTKSCVIRGHSFTSQRTFVPL